MKKISKLKINNSKPFIFVFTCFFIFSGCGEGNLSKSLKKIEKDLRHEDSLTFIKNYKPKKTETIKEAKSKQNTELKQYLSKKELERQPSKTKKIVIAIVVLIAIASSIYSKYF